MNKNTKKTLKQVGLPVGIFLALSISFLLTVYFALFKPYFTRRTGEYDTLRHFVTEENIQKNINDSEWFYSQKPEEITIQSFDGLKLVAYNLPAKKAKGTWLLIHGHQSGPLLEYASIAKFLYESGYNVVLPYQRSHGKSEGKYITYGIKERFDVRDWITKVNEIYGTENPLYIEGISMGCASVLMSLSFELPSNIKSIVADCGFTSPYDIIWKFARKDRNLPLVRLVMKAGNFMANAFADFDFEEYDTFRGMKKNTLPILFIHGTNDSLVPIEMTIANFQYCSSEKSLYLVEGAPHAISYIIDEEGYHKHLVDFCGLK